MVRSSVTEWHLVTKLFTMVTNQMVWTIQLVTIWGQFFHSATFIEIALSNVAVHQRPTFALQKAAKKGGRTANLLNFYNQEIDP